MLRRRYTVASTSCLPAVVLARRFAGGDDGADKTKKEGPPDNSNTNQPPRGYGPNFGRAPLRAPMFPGQAPTYQDDAGGTVDFEKIEGAEFHNEAFGGVVVRDPRPTGAAFREGGKASTAPRPASFEQQDAEKAEERRKARALDAERTRAAAEARDDPIQSTVLGVKTVIEDTRHIIKEKTGGALFGSDEDLPPGTVGDAGSVTTDSSAAAASAPSSAAAPTGAKYKKSRDVFTSGRVTLTDSFAGDPNKQVITWWENIWWNWIKYLVTRDILVGKDKYGNHFTASWYFLRTRHEVRQCKRLDKKKAFQPYGALPTDDRLWEAWLRGWRNDPPTIEECDAFRKRQEKLMGVHRLDGEEVENTLVRLLAQTKNGSSYLQELDDDQKYANQSLKDVNQRAKEADIGGELDATWTAGFIRGDVFYNEEEVETMRQNLSHIYRDREWQTLEMKRQTRLNKAPHPIGKPKEGDDLTSPFAMGQPISHFYDRTDGHVPMHQGIADLTTPELEKLRAECDAIEDERIALRKELGLMELGDFREGRPATDKGYDPFQPPPTSGRWKPRCWQECWGTGGANPY